jgi:hypothetical protein
MTSVGGCALMRRPGDGMAVRLQAASQRRSRGPQSEYLARLADRPSERRRLEVRPLKSDPGLSWGRSQRLPSATSRRQGGADWGEAVLRYPARLVAWPAKRRAAVGGGRAGRPSRPAPEFWSVANGRVPGRPAPPPHDRPRADRPRPDAIRIINIMEKSLRSGSYMGQFQPRDVSHAPAMKRVPRPPRTRRPAVVGDHGGLRAFGPNPPYLFS